MRACQTIAVVLAAAAPWTRSHGILVDPKPTIRDGVPDKTNYCGTIDGYKALPGEKYDDSPEYNTNAFVRQFKKSSFTSLKALVHSQPTTCGECGITRDDGTPQPMPLDGIVKWGHGNEGYVSSHEGPCEVWCDATRVYSNDNCARNIPNGAMPINVAACKGAKRLLFVWLAMHTSSWQVYINCVPLLGGVGAAPPSLASASYSPPSVYTPRTPSPTLPVLREAKPMQQCGGKQFNGPTRCTAGYVCEPKNEWYSQCVERSSDGVATWGQCGGQGYAGATTCKPTDECQIKNNWYSQCVPRQ
ncbi:hypothetical protein H310_05432 [Aphanomyces invadans]|uniref:CBM1 domain-containing protein n=1 Tax=Aphanomyces invadans TaxID=157072 RepID=A0A024U9A9_9STRA|nr:hypothetical protein H310_05432 [Aphanomyces invadans]ETW02996.1 hypothetical protein H310_05432 [Aphanomyces invadans]RHY26817.1 hypothetical protein DYB32_007260 [Aphanomyces invadans]|eukprot:XP_008868380.1 hypothetical protein H310_05432 [Aphanomyces invadans]